MICYDLRFPVWAKNQTLADEHDLEYDVLIYVANWPAPRTNVWDTLLRARAMENQSYTIGVNRTGSDGEGIDYLGSSVVYDYKGQAMHEISKEPTVETVTLDKEEMMEFRKKFPVYLDWDKFSIEK